MNANRQTISENNKPPKSTQPSIPTGQSSTGLLGWVKVWHVHVSWVANNPTSP